MNSVAIKYKSFLTSVFIHLFIAALVTAVYMKYKDTTSHEKRTLVHLKALHYVEPTPLVTPVKKIKKHLQKKFVKTMPLVKKKPTPVLKKKIVPRKKIVMVKAKPLLEKPVETVVVKAIEKIIKPAVEVQQIEVVVQEQEVVPIVSVSPVEEYMDENLAIINALIKKNLSYPRLAKKRGLQGRAYVDFTIDTQGHVSGIRASGELASILKKSARKTVEKASMSFPHPAQALTLQIPIVYKLH